MTHDELQQLKPGDTVTVLPWNSMRPRTGVVGSVKRLGAFVIGAQNFDVREEFFSASELTKC